jgi:hypothetical protein
MIALQMPQQHISFVVFCRDGGGRGRSKVKWAERSFRLS